MSIGYKRETLKLYLETDPSVYYEIEPTIADIEYPAMSYKIIQYGDNVQNVIEDMTAKGYTKNSVWLLQGFPNAKYKFERTMGVSYGEWESKGRPKNYYYLAPFWYTIYEYNPDRGQYYDYNSIVPEGIVLKFALDPAETSFKGCGVYLLACLDKYERPVYMFKGVPCSNKANKTIERIPPSAMTSYYTDHRNTAFYSNGYMYPYYGTSYISDKYVFMGYKGTYDPEKAYPTYTYGFPYGDGESTSQGGQGEMDDTTEPIEIDSKPLLTTGEFLRVYKMTATNLTALRDKLISAGFLDNLIAKLRTDAMDYIVGLNAIPFASTSVAESTIKIANLDTEIAASYLTWYIEDFDFGEINLKEYFQTFMDYSPYTKLSVFVPFCGIVPLNVDQFMDDKIKMKCRIDLLTGQFVVFISNSVGIVTTVSGNCAYQLPIRANDYNRLVTSGLGLLGGIVGTAGALATGNIPLAVGAGLGTVGGLVATSQAMTKPDVTSKGSLGGNYGLLGNRTPYLIIQRPTISVPKDYGKTLGYMSRITSKLGDLTGFTVVEEIHLEHISATDDEKKLIENALKSGVIL